MSANSDQTGPPVGLPQLRAWHGACSLFFRHQMNDVERSRMAREKMDRGELPRGEVPMLLGLTDRHARRIVAALTEAGALASKSSRAPLRLAFPAKLASRWMPGLFPEKTA